MITRRRILTKKINEGVEGTFVDLGLPSGLLWAKGNIVKDEQGNYSIGNETDYGCYFSWGNVEGHNIDEGYDFGTRRDGPYANTHGAQLTTDIPNNSNEYDAAYACLGSPCHIPTMNDYDELLANTDKVWTTINGVNGWKLMKKTNNEVYIFIPAAGALTGKSDINELGEEGYYWLSTIAGSSGNSAFMIQFYSNTLFDTYYNGRYIGSPIRAVRGI